MFTLKRLLFTTLAGVLLPTGFALAETVDITFPVIGDYTYSDDFGVPRSGGRTHEGNDIIAAKHTPVVATTDGVLSLVAYPEPYYGYAVFLNGDDGYDYWYIHLNNDNFGTDDGLGGGMRAYAPYISTGNRVKEGQLLGWLGDSGNAEETVDHLHFEMHRSDGTIINPYESLQAATVLSSTSVNPPNLSDEILPYKQAKQTTSIALGDVTGDGEDDLVVAPGAGEKNKLKIMDTNGNVQSAFFPYDEQFEGGADVTLADIDGDGVQEIVTAAGPGGGPHVRIFDSEGNVLKEFFAYEKDFRGGVRVAAADLNGNGKDSIITAPGEGRKPQVRVYKSSGKIIRKFMAYEREFTNGVYVTAQPFVNDKKKTVKIITGPGPGRVPQVRVYNRLGEIKTKFKAYATDFEGGVNVESAHIDSSKNVNRLITTPASNGTADVRVFTNGGTLLSTASSYEPWYLSGFDVAANEDNAFITHWSTDRRSSIWDISGEL